MSDFDEIVEEAMGGSRPLGAAADFVESCRLYLTRRKFAEDQFSAFFSRLGEVLLHRGWREHAVACARIAFELRPEDEGIANLCAWVFSNCGRHEDAAAAYERKTPPRHTKDCCKSDLDGPRAIAILAAHLRLPDGSTGLYFMPGEPASSILIPSNLPSMPLRCARRPDDIRTP